MTEGMTDSGSAIPEEVRRLAEASEAILRWIERLSDHALEARPEVVERIRRDYQLRLQSSDTRLAAQRPLLLELVSEREAVLAALRDDLAGQAADLEELELRREVGELDEAELRARRAPVEREMSDLGARIEQEKGVVEMLAGVLERTAPSAGAPAVVPPTAPAAEPFVVSDPAPLPDPAPPPESAPPPEPYPSPEPVTEFSTEEETPAPDPEPAPDVAPAMEIVAAAVPEPDEVGAEHTEPDVAEADVVEAEIVEPDIVSAEDAGSDEEGSEDVGAGDEDAGTEGADRGFADELDFLESLSLGEAGPFDAVSAMLDEEEKTGDKPA